MTYPHNTIVHQSRPDPVDMTARPWGPLTALEPTWSGYWRFRCTAGHEPIMHGSRVRVAARKVETGKSTTYARCPMCRKKRP